MHGGVDDPCFVCLAVRRRWESHGEHCRTGRRHDELTRSSRNGDALRVRVTENVQRRSIVRERTMKRGCPEAQHDRRSARGDRDGRGDRDTCRPATTQRDDVLPFVVRRLEGSARAAPEAAQAPRRRTRGSLRLHATRPVAACRGRIRRDGLRSARDPRPSAHRGHRGLRAREGLRPYGSKTGFVRRLRSVRNYSSGSFWTLCSVAYSSVRPFTASMPSA